MGRVRRHVLLACVWCAAALGAQAQPFPRASVPRALQDWIPWALDGAEERVCPAVGGSAVCLWPGRVRLEATASGARFSIEAHAERALDLPLPGGARRWPLDVTLDGAPAVVLGRSDLPVVRLPAGDHRLEGRFAWERLPDALAVPAAFALLELSVEGRAVALPRRDESGLLLLRQADAGAGEGEKVQLKVFRRVADGMPPWVETRVVFDVSGRARELALSGALVADTAPVAVSGELPARLDADGRLRVQVRAGTFTVTVLARVKGRGDKLMPPAPLAPWPTQEVWVFAAAERLRQVELGGATPMDPSRTDLPDEWRALPAFLLEPGGALAIRELRRGEPEAAPDRITLRRTLWLDQSGRGFTARDEMRGRLGRTSRLDLRAPGELGRVTLDGAGQLVTRAAPDGAAGVEVRAAELKLEADSRLPGAGALPAVGWDVSVQSLSAELRVPPGWRLLAATGVDSAPGSWAAGWDLYAFFFVILTAVAADRVLGRRWGLLALAALVALHGETGAPRFVWLYLVGALALAGAAPPGRLRALARAALGLGLLVLVLTLIPFAVTQVRSGLFPQSLIPYAWDSGPVARLGRAFKRPESVAGIAMLDENAPVSPPPAAMAPQASEEALRSQGYVTEARQDKAGAARREANVLSYSQEALQKAYAPDPHAVIQTGAGVPAWHWDTYGLAWSGPVAKEQTLRLYLLSPGVNLLLALLRVALAALLALRVFAAVWPALAARLPWLGPPPPAAPEPPDAPPPAAVAVLALLALFAPSSAHAQDAEPPSLASQAGLVPSPELLAELRARLTRAAACAPHCVTTSRLHLAVEGGDLRLSAEVHAGALAAWPVPGPAASFVPRGVTLDGRPAEARLVRLADGFLHLRVEPGVHRVELRGPLPLRDSLTLQFGQPPRRVTASTPGWQVDGLRDDGSADASVQLSRRLATPAAAGTSGSYEPWLEVTRVLDIGVSWSVETSVRRVSPPGEPIVVKVPLLKGMLVTDGERQVKDGEVLVTLGRTETEARWSATLEAVEGASVTLKAPEGKPWSEVWSVRCGPVWQCALEGLPPVGRFQDGQLAPEFRPWPGESLTLTFRRPQGAPGRSVTVDAARLSVTPGLRLEDGTLLLSVRASRPSPLTLTLPEGAEVQSLKVKDVDRPIRPDGRKLTVTLDVGAQNVSVAWRRSGGLGLVHRVAGVELSEAAVNNEVSLRLPEGRWLLLTGGPSWGPSVLFWGYLVCIVALAYVLARVPRSPLSARAWVLLALGLSQVPLVAAALVAGWFLALAWRQDRVLERAWRHNLVQLALVVWTLVALGVLYAGVYQGLLLRPDMQVAGGGGTDTLLRWYQDRTSGALPRPWVLSLPLWTYRLVMLAWSLWLALSLVRWLRWGWASFSSGALWQPLRRAKL
jgi:hypothetical protein